MVDSSVIVKNVELSVATLGSLIEQEVARAQALDHKASSLTGYGAVVLSLLVASLGLLFSDGVEALWRDWALVSLAICVLLIGFSMGMAVRQLAPLPYPEVDNQDLQKYVEVENLIAETWEHHLIEAKTRIAIVQQARKQTNRRANAIRRSFIFFMWGIGAIVAYGLFLVLSLL